MDMMNIFQLYSVYAIFKWGPKEEKDKLKGELGEEKYKELYEIWRGTGRGR